MLMMEGPHICEVSSDLFRHLQSSIEKSASAGNRNGIDFQVGPLIFFYHAGCTGKKDRRPGPLFEVDWHRVILDEAQSIKNAHTLASHASRCLQVCHILNTGQIP